MKRRFRIYLYTLCVLALCYYSVIYTEHPEKIQSNWLTHKTSHFFIFYEKDSPAQQDLEKLVLLLEKYYRDISDMFQIRIARKIPYYFHNQELYHFHKPIWGYATQESIHVVYKENKKDSSSHELRHFIQNIVNSDVPYFFNEGICGYGIQIGAQGFHEKIKQTKINLEEYPIQELVFDFQKHGRFGDYLAYSFNGFLVEKYGEAKYAEFYKKTRRHNWQKTLEQTYEKPLLTIENEWKEFIIFYGEK